MSRIETIPIRNEEIAGMFSKTADLLEIDGADPFRVRAYRNAAMVVESQARSLADMVRSGEDLSVFPGIGKELSGKIREIVETGRLRKLQDLEEKFPEGLISLMGIAGLGPKRIRALYEHLRIDTEERLREAAEHGEISGLKGFGKKIEQRILEEISRRSEEGGRIKLITAMEIGRMLLSYVRELHDVKEAVIAGSYRRRKETVGDLDILAICTDRERVMEHFMRYPDAARVLSKGTTRSALILRSGLQADLRAVPEESYGTALHYFTGSKAHDIAVRAMGQRHGLKINEYGVFKGDDCIAGRTEDEVYRAAGLVYIEPELREDRGEIEAALNNTLPRLITLSDIRGDLHTHTTLTDGRDTLEDMVRAALERGYEYIAITDHSPRVTIARGVDSRALMERLEEIDRLGERLPGISILKSAEVDILEDGTLDYPDDVLARLDLTVCSVHYHQRLPRDRQTERVVRAMDNPFFTVFGHPTGRLINERPPYEIDMDKVMDAAKERGCFLELNAHPDRLDLTDALCRAAKDKGVGIVISTDAHSVHHLSYMSFGINQARRGWLEKDDVLNCLHEAELKQRLRR